MEKEEAVILEPYEIHFSDLLLLSSDKVSSSSFPTEEIERLESIRRRVMENLGPAGPGLLTITGVPNASRLRRTLLPLARRLALLNPDDRKRVLKEHSLGSDVPLKNLDRSVSSFAMQLKYEQSTIIDAIYEGNEGQNKEQHDPVIEESVDFQESEFKNLGNNFKELGFCMMELGIRLAQICDRAIGGKELEQSLLESHTAKGRLIHYHSTLDNLILKEDAERRQYTKHRTIQLSTRKEHLDTNQNEARSCEDPSNESNLWQQWHYDYGIFTVLTAPLFILPHNMQTKRSNGCLFKSFKQEHPSPSGHTYLQIFVPSKSSLEMVKANPESFIVQVGESAEILSKGRLHANLHSVSRPTKLKDLSREMFVIFLQPAWSKTLSLSDYSIKYFESNYRSSSECTEETHISDKGDDKLGKELHKIVPPLSSRLRDGMTFAEFSRETTRQYYGGTGLQSKR